MMKKFVEILVVCLVGLSVIAFADAGSSNDPLISLSYIENTLKPQLEKYIDSKIGSMDNSYGGGSVSSSGDKFTVVNLKKGNRLICEAGSELILRMGQAVIIATPKGGLADTTAGYDLPDGTLMPSNHLLIVPVADGRGMLATSDGIVMVKGGYSIE
ncbi:MAG: hypothetical protein J6C17_05025 [Clostridia bacterium]|nr:hypothetical protein [Clostridia bacterium]